MPEPDSPKMYWMSELMINLCTVLLGWCFLGAGIVLAQSTVGVPPEATKAETIRSVADSGTLAHDILQQRVSLNAASTVTESTVVQHSERPFRRKPRKNVLVDVSLIVVVCAAVGVAWVKRRHTLRGRRHGRVAARDTGGSLQIETHIVDAQRGAPSDGAREECVKSTR
jgi:hypothetical protein